MARCSRATIGRRETAQSSPARRGQFSGIHPPPFSDAQQLPPRRQAAPQPEPGRQQRRAADAQRPRVQARGVTHGGAAQREAAGEQRLEHLLPYGRVQRGVERLGPGHVSPGTARHETTSPDAVGWVAHGTVLGADLRPTGPRGLAGEKAPWAAEAVRLDQDRSPAAGADALFPRCPAPTGLRAPETRPVSGDRVSSPTARPEAARHLPGLSPAPGKWRGTPYPSGGAQEKWGQRRPCASVARAAPLPSPHSQQQCASWGTSMACAVYSVTGAHGSEGRGG